MMDSSEKRDFARMPVHGPLTLRDGADHAAEMGELLDLSATGCRFISQRALDQGARLQITVNPQNPITPPLEAEISVLRCEPIDRGFDIAATIELVEPAIYLDRD